MTIDTRASMTFTRPDFTEGLPERELSQPYILQITLMKTLPTLKEMLVVPAENLDVFHAHDAAMGYDWVRKKCCCEAPGHDYIHPPLPRVT
jgi:hypothetical protein